MKFSTIEQKNKEFHAPTWMYVIVGVIIASVFVVASLHITFNMVYRYYPVSGTSMQPTINEQWNVEGDVADGVYVNLFNKGQRGDVVVIEKATYDPVKSKWIDVIKRIIAVGGDKIAICPVLEIGPKAYKLLVIYNGETDPTPLEEAYLSEQNKKSGNYETYKKLYNSYMPSNQDNFELINGVWYLVVPEGKVFYLGDNRLASKDCSEYGPMAEDKVVGKVDIIIRNEADFLPQILDFFGQQIVKLFV